MERVDRAVLFILGCRTTFLARIGAFLENDLKKIIALSTLSQLGVIVFILSLGWAELAFIHLLSHALFKSLLFISAGSIIHRSGGHQDVRFMGSFAGEKPLTISLINLANLSLCGTPFLAGFYSKDLILEVVTRRLGGGVGIILIILSTGLTVSYTFRVTRLVVRGEKNGSSLRFVDDEE